ncbi:lytic transglycosylase domain-containing protein [Sphingobacterium haloxyli]|uniref:Lytic transglycosylase n=1 Tax=Sphingobacterium haloxyli TaxID=2100533 RepID=A0A2S9J5D0_9SPHI|nr:lytic transglycosylase domain-containing protein [Sphingobacterium haloxyli]PRD47967.1 lytic transglycosylase [Sphingobacterium haloxyli]
MIKNRFWLILFCVLGLKTSLHAQDMVSAETELVPLHLIEAASSQREIIISALDSLKTLSYCDPLYTKEDSVVFNRMRKIQRTIPLALNEKIKSYIDKYISRNYNPYLSKLQGLAEYYFPIYEKILAENQLPDEIKYISVVESSLDPHLVSRSGAVGLWQFMYPTAKGYDLTMDSYIDERKDPYAASYAASRYFLDAYDEFNDWLLALASYNCGRGCVRRAIQRSGLESPNFWELSAYLPKETQDYIPKFIAMTYTLKHADEYGISAMTNDFAWEAKPIMVEKTVDLQQIAYAVNLPLETIKKFNPAYKRSVINASAESPRRLILPDTEYLSDSLLYAALNNQLDVSGDRLARVEEISPTPTTTHLSAKKRRLAATSSKFTKRSAATYTTYTVKKGDTLSHIAARFKGATISQIKADNSLRSTRLKIGQKLRIKKS